MKRLLNIKDREKVESGEYKVFTRDGKGVRVICWDKKSEEAPIVALVAFSDGRELAISYSENGGYIPDSQNEFDLLVEIPDEKIPFDMKYKEDILAGKVKVQTKDGKDVRIISFDGPGNYPVVGVYLSTLLCWTNGGRYVIDSDKVHPLDLVIIKSE